MTQGTTYTDLRYQGLLDPFDRLRNQGSLKPPEAQTGPGLDPFLTHTPHKRPTPNPGLGRSEGSSLGKGQETTSQGAKPDTPEMATERRGIAAREL